MRALVVCVSLVFTICAGQRPSYAGSSSKGYPELASRFRDPSDTNAAADAGIGNRLGQTDSTNERIPVDARGDVDLVNRLNQWPREHRPFWLINSEHIEKHRQIQAGINDTSGQNNAGQTISSRSSFGDETIPIKPTQRRSTFLGALRT